eukprot:5870821-Amphidinium_carterae.1
MVPPPPASASCRASATVTASLQEISSQDVPSCMAQVVSRQPQAPAKMCIDLSCARRASSS